MTRDWQEFALHSLHGRHAHRHAHNAREYFKEHQQLRHKQGRSLTQTETMSRRGSERTNIHSGTATVNLGVRSGLKQPKSILRSADIKMDEVSWQSLTTNPGQQAVGIPMVVGSYQQGYATGLPQNPAFPGAAGGPDDPFQPVVPFISLIPDIDTINTSYYAAFGTPATGHLPGADIMLKSCEASLQIRNSSNIAAYVDVFVCQAKRDIPSFNNGDGTFTTVNCGNMWDRGLVAESLNVANQTPLVVANTGGAVGACVSTTPFARPRQTRMFTDNYRIVKAHHINLAAGSEETVNVHMTMNLPYIGEKDIPIWSPVNAAGKNIQPAAATTFAVGTRKHAFEVMIVLRGAMMWDTNAAVKAPTLGGTEILIGTSKKYRLALLKSTNKKYRTTQARNHLVTNPALTDLLQVNVQDSTAGGNVVLQ